MRMVSLSLLVYTDTRTCPKIPGFLFHILIDALKKFRV